MGPLRDCVALCADREGENLAKDTLRTILTSLHLKSVVGRSVKWCSHFENSLTDPQKHSYLTTN